MDKKGNMGTLSNVALGIVGFIVAIFIGYKIGSVLLSTETAGTLTYNQTAALMGDNGLGLVVDLAPIAILMVVVFGAVLVYFRYFK